MPTPAPMTVADYARAARVLSDWFDVQRERGKTHRDLRIIAQRLVPGLTGGEFDEAMCVADEAE